LEQKVLLVARRKGEAEGVLMTLRGLAQDSGDPALASRADTLR